MIGFRLRVLFSIFVASSCVVQSIGFKWEQHLNPNGKAESIECSSVSGSDLFQGSILDKVESEFIDYPRFLARRKVLLGLFTAEKKFHVEADDHKATSCWRIIGLPAKDQRCFAVKCWDPNISANTIQIEKS